MTLFLSLAAATIVAQSAYHVDLTHYFPSPAAEQASRGKLIDEVGAFASTSPAAVTSAKALETWLRQRDRLLIEVYRHESFVYLRSEQNLDDRVDQDADEDLGDAADHLDRAASNLLPALSRARLEGWLAQDAALSPYRFFIETSLAKDAPKAPTPAGATMTAALESLESGYKSLANAIPPNASPSGSNAKQAFTAKWAPFVNQESLYAALLLPIVELQDGRAREHGALGAPDAALKRQGLSPAQVSAALSAVRQSRANRDFQAVLAAAAARRRGVVVSEVGPWDLDAADGPTPDPVAFPDALAIVLAAEQPMGRAYASQYARLLDPHQGRLDWCREPSCDHTGFSVGFAGVESSLFYGSYRGDTNSIRAVAHEAGHAVHHQFMNENQPIAAYNLGPNFMLESFAIFNELLLLDHLSKTAATPGLKAYYLHQFIGDATHQVFGSAQETDLESSIYAGVRAGKLHSAADLDALTLKVLARYNNPEALAPELRASWAQNRLYFTDPLYDTNYLFAGLLALEYLKRFEADPSGFAPRYVALLKNGFDDTPVVLEKRFLGIDLDNLSGLVADADALIGGRTRMLAALYGIKLAT